MRIMRAVVNVTIRLAFTGCSVLYLVRDQVELGLLALAVGVLFGIEWELSELNRKGGSK